MDTGQKTESLAQLVGDIDRMRVALPEFQRDFVWEIDKTYDLFDSFVRDIFVGSLIYGVPSFEITVRELDTRPRNGKGSRKKLKLQSFSREEIDRKVKTDIFRLLLDGQQRATSIYRTLKGIDAVFFEVADDNILAPETQAKDFSERTLEEMLSEFRGSPQKGKINIKLSDVYDFFLGKAPREKDKAEYFLRTCNFDHITKDNVQDSEEFSRFLICSKEIENLLRQEKLVAYYLLDTDEEKFALFFERSNSKGIQLNFIDILAAKLYGGFNLREKIEEFEDKFPNYPLNREVIVRTISYIVSDGKETGRAYILGNLNYGHFSDYWYSTTEMYRKCYEFLIKNNVLVHPNWMPYDNMLIPMMSFLRGLQGRDSARANDLQIRILLAWYWLAIFSRKYSSAAQSYVVEDAQALRAVSDRNYSSVITLLTRLNYLIRSHEDFYTISKRFDAMYKGVLNLCHYASGGLRNLENGTRILDLSNLEDHHIFPKDYLKKFQMDQDIEMSMDCVVNRTIIGKISNIKISNKPPSVYLKELRQNNPNLDDCLESHLVPPGVATGEYDDVYGIFIEDRVRRLFSVLNERAIKERDRLLAELRSPDAS
jgi:hypothetical protein